MSTTHRTQVTGYNLWAEQRADGWHIVDDAGESQCGPFATEHRALSEARAMVNTSGT